MAVFLSVLVAAGNLSYGLCGTVGDDRGDVHSLRHSHGGYEHHRHHHHNDTDGGQGGEHDGIDHVSNDLKTVRSSPRLWQLEAPSAWQQAPSVTVVIAAAQAGENRGITSPRAGPDPSRQLRQIRSIVLLV